MNQFFPVFIAHFGAPTKTTSHSLWLGVIRHRNRNWWTAWSHLVVSPLALLGPACLVGWSDPQKQAKQLGFPHLKLPHKTSMFAPKRELIWKPLTKTVDRLGSKSLGLGNYGYSQTQVARKFTFSGGILCNGIQFEFGKFSYFCRSIKRCWSYWLMV